MTLQEIIAEYQGSLERFAAKIVQAARREPVLARRIREMRERDPLTVEERKAHFRRPCNLDYKQEIK